MGTPKLPVVFDPRTEKFYYDLPLGDIKSITANPSGTSAGVTSIGGESGAVTLADINLGNVSNTSDANKPVSTAQQTALDLKANIIEWTLTADGSSHYIFAGPGFARD